MLVVVCALAATGVGGMVMTIQRAHDRRRWRRQLDARHQRARCP